MFLSSNVVRSMTPLQQLLCQKNPTHFLFKKSARLERSLFPSRSPALLRSLAAVLLPERSIKRRVNELGRVAQQKE